MTETAEARTSLVTIVWRSYEKQADRMHGDSACSRSQLSSRSQISHVRSGMRRDATRAPVFSNSVVVDEYINPCLN
jgi:hypothetical protein